MHSSVANTPFRSTMLRGPRFFCCFSPLTLTGSSTTLPKHSTRLKRPISSLSSKCSEQMQRTLFNNLARTRLSIRRGAALTNSRPSVQFIVTTSIKRSFGDSASLRATTSPAGVGIGAKNAVPLDWNTFFKLRASRRRFSLVSSVLTSMTTTAIGVQILSTQDLDTLGAQVMGLDPFIVLGLATAACGAMGWLIGPILGSSVWGLIYRQYAGGVAIKEKEFFNRIKRFRVDPSANSIANPVPDYYGEKISSVKGYRQWLKDQRAYNRKKTRFIL